jgi:hypothetical protein
MLTNSSCGRGARGVCGGDAWGVCLAALEGEARRLRALGMTLQAIGRVLGVDEKTVRNVLAR